MLLRGYDPRKIQTDRLGVREACNMYLTELKAKEGRGEVGPRRFIDMRVCCRGLVDSLGADTPITALHPDLFSRLRSDLAKRKRSPITLKNELTRVKTIFNWLAKQGKIQSVPRYGADFNAPSARQLRAHLSGKSDPTYTKSELLALLGECSATMTPMVLLGLSAGFGPTDCVMLRVDTDFTQDILTVPRSKTVIDRRFWVWPELREAIAWYRRIRPQPANDEAAQRLFLTSRGLPWGDPKDAGDISVAFTRAAKRAGCYLEGRSFYGLRHTMLSACTDVGDPLAEKYLMGHVRSDITETYRHKFPDARITKLSQHIRDCLIGSAEVLP